MSDKVSEKEETERERETQRRGIAPGVRAEERESGSERGREGMYWKARLRQE